MKLRAILIYITGVMIVMLFVLFLTMLHYQHQEKMQAKLKEGYQKALTEFAIPDDEHDWNTDKVYSFEEH